MSRIFLLVFPLLLVFWEFYQPYVHYKEEFIGITTTTIKTTIFLEQPLENFTLPATAVVILCYNRPEYLQRTLQSLFEKRLPHEWEVYVSQDGDHPGVKKVIESFQSRYPIHHLQFQYDEATWSQRTSPLHPTYDPKWRAHYKISAHYLNMLTKIFDISNFDRVIILEDDMELAPDFVDYFQAASGMFEKDPSVLCVSAWNDNGRKDLATDFRKLHRTDCFPGLGWMLHRKLWEELRPNWPPLFWDDWMRLSYIRKRRSCIYPEVNRVFTFGKEGSSGGQFFDEYLSKIQLNDQVVDWKKFSWESMMEPTYGDRIGEILNRAVLATVENFDQLVAPGGFDDVMLVYEGDQESFKYYAKRFGLMEDFREGIPRGSYQGVVPFWQNQTKVWLVPSAALAISVA